MDPAYTFLRPHDFQDKWTEISFPVHRYGYGWGLNGTFVILAAVVLIVHSVVIIAHCAHVIWTGTYYGFADSLGELLALALTSRPAEPLEKHSVEVCDNDIWFQPVAVRKRIKQNRKEEGKGSQEKIEMVFGKETVTKTAVKVG